MSTISAANASQLGQFINSSGVHRGSKAQRHAEFNAAAQSLGLDQTKTDAIRKQIDDAIAAAQKGGAKPGARDTIKQAVDSVLKQNGIDPKAFHAALHKAHAANTRGGEQGTKTIALNSVKTNATNIQAAAQPATDGDAGNGRVNLVA